MSINNFKLSNLNWFNSAIVLVIILHVLTLNISPIAWFDEVFFLDVSLSFSENGKLTLPMSPTYDKDILTYGPVYFLLTSLSLKLFGLGIIQFRLVNLLFGVLSIFMFKKILVKHYQVKNILANILTLILFIHSTYHSNLHSGRMDLVALFFVMCGIYALFKKGKYDAYVAGVLFSLALLTTPRVAVLLVGIPVFLLVNLVQTQFSKKSILLIFKMGISVFAVYAIWFFYAFGSIDNFISYYSSFSNYVGGSVKLPMVIYPILFLGGFSLFLLYYKQESFKTFLSPLFMIPFVAILAFHFLVSITSIAYYALVIPFYLLVFGYAVTNVNIRSKFKIFKKNVSVIKLMLYPIIGIFGFILIFKIGIIAISYSERNPSGINEFIGNETNPNSILIGDYKYGYASKLNNLHFISYEYNVEGNEKKFDFINYLNNKNVNYFMVSDNSLKNNEFAREIITKGNFEKIAEFKTEKTELIQKIMRLIPIKFDNNYNGVLYKSQN